MVSLADVERFVDVIHVQNAFVGRCTNGLQQRDQSEDTEHQIPAGAVQPLVGTAANIEDADGD
ncbi:hypothetical protein SDC9_63255 [bioreactor metagenome]|uniref:Uncharacterized protein n=1 Tax=bioreactor metagenome TaxID=1076179 RepID=A0A644XRI9_9ZZZZ